MARRSTTEGGNLIWWALGGFAAWYWYENYYLPSQAATAATTATTAATDQSGSLIPYTQTPYSSESYVPPPAGTLVPVGTSQATGTPITSTPQPLSVATWDALSPSQQIAYENSVQAYVAANNSLPFDPSGQPWINDAIAAGQSQYQANIIAAKNAAAQKAAQDAAAKAAAAQAAQQAAQQAAAQKAAQDAAAKAAAAQAAQQAAQQAAAQKALQQAAQQPTKAIPVQIPVTKTVPRNLPLNSPVVLAQLPPSGAQTVIRQMSGGNVLAQAQNPARNTSQSVAIRTGGVLANQGRKLA